MESNSDTESDRSSPSPLPNVYEQRDPVPPALSAPVVVHLDEVKQHMSKLASEDFLGDSASLTNASLRNELQESTNTLISFVDQLSELLLKNDASGVFSIFAALVDISFLDKLFIYRQKIRRTATNVKGISRTTTIVTWVDELLAKINDALRIVSWRGTPPVEDIEYASTTRSIESQKRHDVLRAVIQLPEKFFDVHVVVGSVNFSPAARRIATSLLFATYVVGPQIEHVRTWPNVGPTPSVISSSLHFSASHMSAELCSPSHAIDLLPRRVMAAMSIALFSVVDYHTTSPERDDFISHELRPEGYRHLLDLIRAVLNQSTDSYMPVEQLDISQAIILYWGNVLPWSWSTWDDQRIADTEYLSALTATWLYHLDTPLSAGEHTVCKDAPPILFVDLRVKTSDLAILLLLQRIVHDLADIQGTDSRRYIVLVKLLGMLFGIVLQHLESNVPEGEPAIEARLFEYTTSVLLAYSFLGTTEDDILVKNLAVEIISLAPSEILAASICSVIKTQTQFLLRLEKATRSCTKTIRIYAANDIREREIKVTKILAEFLTLTMASVQAEEMKPLHKIAAPFIAALASLLKANLDNRSRIVDSLRDPLLTMLGIVSFNVSQQPSDEDVWALALHYGTYNMITAGSFAEYLLKTGRLCSPFFVYEAWNYLLSVLITILCREILQEEEPLALLSVSSVCCGLYELVRNSSMPTRDRILSSPWTATMKLLLQRLADNTATDPYIQSLSRRLMNIGGRLLREITIDFGVEEDNLTQDKAVAASYSSRLIYYRDSTYSGLLFVRETESV